MEVIAHHAHQSVSVVEASQPSAVRFAARSLADRAGFTEVDSYRAGIVATELATNLVKHSTGGEVLLRAVADGAPELELIAIDRGPGIRDLSSALVDGQSTAPVSAPFDGCPTISTSTRRSRAGRSSGRAFGPAASRRRASRFSSPASRSRRPPKPNAAMRGRFNDVRGP
jgi:anti-sigma regulatory factor (Ser/Thr protein kinase)